MMASIISWAPESDLGSTAANRCVNGRVLTVLREEPDGCWSGANAAALAARNSSVKESFMVGWLASERYGGARVGRPSVCGRNGKATGLMARGSAVMPMMQIRSQKTRPSKIFLDTRFPPPSEESQTYSTVLQSWIICVPYAVFRNACKRVEMSLRKSGSQFPLQNLNYEIIVPGISFNAKSD